LAGRVRKNIKKTLKIPAGIDNGQTLRLPNMGSAGHRGGPNGDLYVTIGVRSHKQFVRKGFDLYLEIPISYTMAALGGSITVPTLRESVKYTIPAGTQPGSTLPPAANRALSTLKRNGATGDLLVTVKVEVPKHLTEEQKSLLETVRRNAVWESGDGRTGKKKRVQPLKQQKITYTKKPFQSERLFYALKSDYACCGGSGSSDAAAARARLRLFVRMRCIVSDITPLRSRIDVKAHQAHESSIAARSENLKQHAGKIVTNPLSLAPAETGQRQKADREVENRLQGDKVDHAESAEAERTVDEEGDYKLHAQQNKHTQTARRPKSHGCLRNTSAPCL
jgi:hypothetical protein